MLADVRCERCFETRQNRAAFILSLPSCSGRSESIGHGLFEGGVAGIQQHIAKAGMYRLRSRSDLFLSVSPRMSWLPKLGLSSHEPIPNCMYPGSILAPDLWAALFRVCFGLGPAYREFASASALVFRVCFGLGPLGQLIASLHRPRPSRSHVLPHYAHILLYCLSRCLKSSLFPIVSSSQSTHSLAQFSSMPNSRNTYHKNQAAES